MKVELKGLDMSFDGKQILNHVDMAIAEGEFVSILGPSGCGKSTLLNMLAGVLPKANGKIFVDGEEVSGVSDHFAYMPQDDLLFPWKSILDNVCLYGRLHHHKEEARKQALEGFTTFGLAGYEHAYPNELSGGMRQRAAFLRTALCHADVLLLDEPFGALDVITRGDMQDWLQSMRTRLNKTTILVTHDIDEAIYLSDRILILSGHPANIKQEIIIKESNRTREWLYAQSKMRTEIYQFLKEENHA